MTESARNILAIEVGSSRVKLGWFPAAAACTSYKPVGKLPIAPLTLPEPSTTFRVEHRRDEKDWIADVEVNLSELNLPADTICALAAVHQAAAELLKQRTLAEHNWSQVVTLTRDDIPIEANVKQPSRVGIDRLLNALAANRIRKPDRPALVVDMGTAMTVNLISSAGVFEGGAIVAGPITQLTALHKATTSLPLLSHSVLDEPPPPVGKSTGEAMTAGAYWAAVGAARELLERMAETCPAVPDVFLTGGASRGVAPHITLQGRPARHMPHLVLSGIRLAADRMLAK